MVLAGDGAVYCWMAVIHTVGVYGDGISRT
jgi:hypothetical protein